MERAAQPNIKEIGKVGIYVDTCQKADGMIYILLEHMF